MRFGPRRMRRDIGKIQQSLVESRQAVWLGQSGTNPVDAVTANEEELQSTALRVRELLV